jgi:hypothetical protein
MKINRTELVFDLGNKLFKFARYIVEQSKIKLEQNKELNERLNILLSIISIEKLCELFAKINEKDIFELGNSIMRIMEDKTEVIESKLE